MPAGPGKQPNQLKITAAERPNTLGLSQRDLALLLDKLEAGDRGKPPARRDYARWPFRHATVKVLLTQPSGAEVGLKMACRNLSRGGIALLHNGYVHPGSNVVVALPRLAGGVKDVPGTIRRCQHRRATLHELGIQFDQQIDLQEFISAGNGVEFFSLEHVNPEKLAGQMMYVDDSDVDFRIVQHFLRETTLAIHRFESAASALEEAKKGFSIIVANWRLPDMKAIEMIEKMREQRVYTPVLVVTSDPVSLMRAGLWDLPNTGMLTKPLTQQNLLRALAERLLIRVADAASDLLDGGTEGQQAMKRALQSQLAEMAQHLDTAAKASDRAALSTLCAQVRVAAPSVGQPHAGEVAERLLALLNEGKDLAGLQAQLNELIAECGRAAAN